ncbi:hypothetical protein KYLE_40 [Pantoea phage Kyle]|uniref:Uncharacterized protein n=1 Tax=Pantoea phage Kyle TaxID=2589665 RepID=A0A514A8P7_9CAUD|nr:tail completion or Neck1 protein [Pantoea phage Kyle]QDH49636.1 hypothetical protein KYLE_40 [Pantoea phage Kyle]
MARSKEIQKQIDMLKNLQNAKVQAGWFETDRYSDEEGGELVAERARKLEYGFTSKFTLPNGQEVDAYTPPRPFMRFAGLLFSADRRRIENNIAKKLFSGKIDADQALAQIGLAMEAKIVDSIKEGEWIGNSYFTIKQKGFDKPLIETGHMWQTVSSKVVK